MARRNLQSNALPAHRRREVPQLPAETGLVVEDAASGFCGAVLRCERDVVLLEDGKGRVRIFPLRRAAFLIDGDPVTLIRPAGPAAADVTRSASGSVRVVGRRARAARASRIWVEGKHDAELVERVWGHDLRVDGVVVEPLDGVDQLAERVTEFGPAAHRRLGVLVDHLVTGSKESRLVHQVRSPHVLVTGHPYVDIWQAVRPAALGIPGGRKCRGACRGRKACAGRWAGWTDAGSRIQRRAGAGCWTRYEAFVILNRLCWVPWKRSSTSSRRRLGDLTTITAQSRSKICHYGHMAPIVWLIAGFALIAAEVLSSGFVLIMLGVGALVAAGVAALGAPIWLEVAMFASTSVALTTLARPALKRRLYTAHVPTNVDALVGDRAIVISTVDAHGGKIKLRGELWSARAFDETEVLEPGQHVTVMNISGATAVVMGEFS